MNDLELVRALHDRFGVDVGNATEGDEDGLVLHADGNLLPGDALRLEQVLLDVDGIATHLEQVVDGLRNDGAILVLEPGVLDNGVVAMANVAEALQTTNEDSQVAILELHGALHVRLARGRRLLLLPLGLGTLRRRLPRPRRAIVPLICARRELSCRPPLRGGHLRRRDLLLPPLLIHLGPQIGGNNVLPRRHVGLDILHGKLIEELLASERGARGCGGRLVRLGLVDDIVEIHLLELGLAVGILLEDVGRAKLENRGELLLGVILGPR